MTSWTEGYVADIPYSLGFYRETVPAYIAFAALCTGRHPGLSLRPRRVLELGIGMGLGLVVGAAANPAIQFEGFDFNPHHVAHARDLADAAGLTNVHVREASFQELALEATEGQHDLDLIVLHGILTWVSAEAHDAIVEIARKRLKPGGLLYVSYNCMPGWAAVLPMQRLMRENAKRITGRSDAQTGSGLDLVQALMNEGANYFVANPNLKARFDKLASMDKSYLAHEYLNANWFIFHFADVADMFGRAKLGFIGSATLIENNDGLAVPQGVRARIAAEADPIFKETLRDIASNKQFRRDLFGRGLNSATPLEQSAFFASVRFAMIVPRSKVSFKFSSPIGDVEGNRAIYGAVADLLARGPASLAEIAALPVFKTTGGTNAALQAVILLVHTGQILPAPFQEPKGADADFSSAKRLNRVVVEKVLQGRTYSFLAAPVVGSGVQATNIELLMLAAVFAEKEDNVETLVDDLGTRMAGLGISWLSEGQAVTDPAAARGRATDEATTFLAEKLPLWRQLGVL